MEIKRLKNMPRRMVTANSMALLFAAFLTTAACTTVQSEQTATQAGQPSITGAAGIVIEEGVPGGIVVETLEVSSKVVSIDQENRILILQNSDGAENDVKVGPEAVNFDQIQVGDMVIAVVTQELVVQLVGEQEATTDGATGIVALAVEGSKPGTLVGEVVQVTATITAIDQNNRTATLSLEDGTSRTLPIRDDIDLSKRKVGEKVVFLATEMIAISVEKP